MSSTVNALAVSGSNLYVGGAFTTVSASGTTMSANRVAKWSGSAWSALLGSGSSNGVNSTVSAFAVNGSDLYVGGSFTGIGLSGTATPANRVAKWGDRANNEGWFRVGFI